MTEFSPREIVSELDRFIVGQNDAKRAVAIALRNRWRRQQLDDSLRDEVVPKNILMIGPTGVGKTEIARRLARLAEAPFVKVEATKFTEVGYVGRDVEQIVRDLVEFAIAQQREKNRREVVARAELAAEERVLDALVGDHAGESTRKSFRDKRGRAYIPGVKIAGKTGTLTRHDEKRLYTWFVGFAPAADPQVAIAALVVNKPLWHIKAPYLARKVLQAHFEP